MNILFLSDNFPPEVNAAASRVFERALYWSRWGHQVTILTCAPNFPEGKLYDNYKNKWYQVEYLEKIRVVRVKTFIYKNSGFFLRTLDFVSYMFSSILFGCVQKKPDLIVATTPQFFAGIGGWILSCIRKTPFILEVSDLWPASVSAVGIMKQGNLFGFFEKIELYLYKKSQAIVTLTHSFKRNMVRRGIDPQKIYVILNGAELNHYYPRNKDEYLLDKYQLKNCFVIGYIGTMGAAHNLQNVIQAAKFFKDRKNIRFIMIGAGIDRENLIKETITLSLKNVIFVEKQPKDKIVNFWSLCDIALVHLKDHPTFAEAIPSKLFEAMAMGLPILLVSPQGEASEIIEAEKVGVWTSASHYSHLVNAIEYLYTNPSHLNEYAKSSIRNSRNYTREHQARLMLDIFGKILQK